MFAAVAYIMQFQLYSTWVNAPQSDITKSVKDFISYANINLTWYAFNFVLILLPTFLIFKIDHDAKGISIERHDESYSNLMHWILGIHIFQFLFNSKIYKLKEAKSKVEHDDDYLFVSLSTLGSKFSQVGGILGNNDDSEESEKEEGKEFPYIHY